MSQTQVKKQEKIVSKKGKKIHTYYEIKSGKLSCNLKKCQRCGSFMAHHNERERWACGCCGYTDYVSK